MRHHVDSSTSQRDLVRLSLLFGPKPKTTRSTRETYNTYNPTYR